MVPGSFRKTFLGYKIGNRPSKRFTSQSGREMIYNDKFSKVNSPRKEKSEAWSQEEARLKISEIEGNIKANLVRVMFWLLTYRS